MTEKITYICDTCEKPVTGDAGWIEVNYGDIQRAQDALRERAEREREEVEAYDGLPPGKSFAERLAEPDIPLAPWHVYHSGCDPQRSGGYGFGIKGADTYRGLLDWTLHIAAKGWLDETNWSEFIQKHALPRNGAA